MAMYLRYIEPKHLAEYLFNDEIDGIPDGLGKHQKRFRLKRIFSFGGDVGFDFEDRKDADEFEKDVKTALKKTMFDGCAIERINQDDGNITIKIPFGYLIFMSITIED